MKIILDLDHSINNCNWESKEELEEYLKIMNNQLDMLIKYELERKESDK